MTQYIVQRPDGAVACQPIADYTQGSWDSRAWDHVPVAYSNERWLTWDTREGADRYARMNGGSVKRVTAQGIEAA